MREPEKSLFPGARSAISGLRYYSPTLGRFINKDPIEEKGGLNLYAFCRNNGVNGWDMLGQYFGSYYFDEPQEEAQPAVAPPPGGYGNNQIDYGYEVNEGMFQGGGLEFLVNGVDMRTFGEIGPPTEGPPSPSGNLFENRRPASGGGTGTPYVRIARSDSYIPAANAGTWQRTTTTAPSSGANSTLAGAMFIGGIATTAEGMLFWGGGATATGGGLTAAAQTITGGMVVEAGVVVLEPFVVTASAANLALKAPSVFAPITTGSFPFAFQPQPAMPMGAGSFDSRAHGQGERNKAAKPSGTPKPYKHTRPDPEDPDKILQKDPHTGKWVRKPKPSDYPESNEN